MYAVDGAAPYVTPGSHSALAAPRAARRVRRITRSAGRKMSARPILVGCAHTRRGAARRPSPYTAGGVLHRGAPSRREG